MDIAIELLRLALSTSEGPEGKGAAPDGFKSIGGWQSPLDLARLYVVAEQAVEDAGVDRAKVALELLRMSLGDGEEPTDH